MNIKLESGEIVISQSYIHESYENIRDIIGFANRRNENRSFLFVSKVLGKHIPVSPSEMNKVYSIFSKELSSESDTFVVGLAETATGLGAGVASNLENKRVYFQHTTRSLLPSLERWFEISESHSHAVSHIVYKPNQEMLANLINVENLILVDDEITTGNTLKQLAKEYLKALPNIKKINIVSLLSWLDDSKFSIFERDIVEYCEKENLIVPELTQNFLFNGSFKFEQNPSYAQKLPELAHKGASVLDCAWNMGRLPVQMKRVEITDYVSKIKKIIKLNCAEKGISIIGTGENMYLPYLIASELETLGFNVTVQSTTRSPVVVDGESIKSCHSIPMNDCESVEHYIYNLNLEKINIVISETGSEEDIKTYQHLGYVL